MTTKKSTNFIVDGKLLYGYYSLLNGILWIFIIN